MYGCMLYVRVCLHVTPNMLRPPKYCNPHLMYTVNAMHVYLSRQNCMEELLNFPLTCSLLISASLPGHGHESACTPIGSVMQSHAHSITVLYSNLSVQFLSLSLVSQSCD
jgi:hypothetical protein